MLSKWLYLSIDMRGLQFNFGLKRKERKQNFKRMIDVRGPKEKKKSLNTMFSLTWNLPDTGVDI